MGLAAKNAVTLAIICFSGCAIHQPIDCDPSNRNILVISACSGSGGGYKQRIRQLESEIRAESEVRGDLISENERLREEMSEVSLELSEIQGNVRALRIDLVNLISQYDQLGAARRSLSANSNLVGRLELLLKELERARNLPIPKSANTKEMRAKREDIIGYIDTVAKAISEIKSAPAELGWMIARRFVSGRLRLIVDGLVAFKTVVDAYVEGKEIFGKEGQR